MGRKIPPGEICYKCNLVGIIKYAERRERNKDGVETGRYICRKHYGIDYSRDVSNNGPNSYNNLKKLLGNRRTGNLDPNSTQAKGDRFQLLTCRWRSIISIIPVEDLNKKNDNYTRKTPIDHTRDSELGILQTQGRLYNTIYTWWNFGNLEVEWDKIFDNMICYCTNEDGTIVERIYIFPKEEINRRKSITIMKNPSKGIQWYEQYRILDKEIIKNVNDIWKEIKDTNA